jgi:hypothetical protein
MRRRFSIDENSCSLVFLAKFRQHLNGRFPRGLPSRDRRAALGEFLVPRLCRAWILVAIERAEKETGQIGSFLPG